MHDPSITLTGLEASNPLAFLAALGLLRVLAHRPDEHDQCRWRLSWRDDGRWVAVLHGSADAEHVIRLAHADVETWHGELALQLAYDAQGRRVSGSERDAIFDLKPDPATFREFLNEAAGLCAPERMRSAGLAAAYGSERVTDNAGKLKPTGLHFTAGQQKFLGMVRELQHALTPDDFREALIGPWRNESRLPSLSWNASAPRMYAYRASNPSDEKRGSVAAAEWLAFVSLPFFPVAARGSRLVTPCIEGGWKDSSMVWPVWTMPLGVPAIRSLLTWAGLRDTSATQQRAAAGIATLYESRILRSEQGGYGSFSPARVL